MKASDYIKYIDDNIYESIIKDNSFVEDFNTYRKDEFLKIYKEKYNTSEYCIRGIINKLGVKRGKLNWYTNGSDDIKISEGGRIPDGYYEGRSNGVEINTKGLSWYTDGVNNILSDSCPGGYYKGITTSSTKGYKFYTNGVNNVSLSSNDRVPDGYYEGYTQSDNRKQASYKRKKYPYNNGYVEIKLFKDDDIPDGYVPGKLTGKIKKETRDRDMLQRGYLRLSDLKEEYGLYWYKRLDNLDKIEFEDPIVYIHEKELPRIKEFCENVKYYGSCGEKEISEFIESIYHGNILYRRRDIIDGKEIDIYLPDKRVAIEYNGIYYHSSYYKENNYHLNKTELCLSKGIRLIHIFEDQWLNHRDICKSIISSSLGIYQNIVYARSCKVKDVDREEEKSFLNINHIQGYIPSSKCIGLYYNNELVQLVSFRKSRFTDDIELLRMCSTLNTNVVGGFSKLVNHCGYNRFISYVDRSLFTGKGYESAGFKLINKSRPSYYYFKRCKLDERLNRINFQKHKLSKVLGDGFDPTLSEIENMENNDYLRVYDCGTLKYLWEKE